MENFNSFLLADDVIVTGLLTAKWSPELKDVRCDLDPVLIANNIRFKRSSHCAYLKIRKKKLNILVFDISHFGERPQSHINPISRSHTSHAGF